MSEVTPKPGETGTPKAPENGTPPPAPTQGNAGNDASEVEKLRKERDQAQMRANQLEKEKVAREKAEADKQARELEEQNEFKTLHEQEKAKREALEGQIAAEANRKELDKAKSTLLSDYSDEVKELAEEAGMTLGSADEADVAAFKEKLDKIQKRLGATGKVKPNNPGAPQRQGEPTGDDLKVALKDPAKFQDLISKRPGLAAMMTPKSQ